MPCLCHKYKCFIPYNSNLNIHIFTQTSKQHITTLTIEVYFHTKFQITTFSQIHPESTHLIPIIVDYPQPILIYTPFNGGVYQLLQ